MMMVCCFLTGKNHQCSSFSVGSLSKKVLGQPSGRNSPITVVLRSSSRSGGNDKKEKGASARQSIAENGNDKTTLNNFWNKAFLRQLFAEMVGTFIIVQLGTAAVAAAIYDGAHMGLFQIASAWIIAVTIAIATTGPISGAHLNPAMSIAFWLVRPTSVFGFGKLWFYMISQLMGATLGALVNFVMYQKKILAFEAKNNIVRGSMASIASAKAFGEYFVYVKQL